jgi:outer membrane protein
MRTKAIGVLLGVLCVISIALVGGPAVQAEEGKWQVRSRLIFILPNDGADGALDAANTEVESDLTIELDGTLFVTPHFGIEGILATAAQEVIIDDGSGGRTSLGSVYHAPATFLGQYHFVPEGKVRPYVGLGVNYTIFYSESGALTDLDLESGSLGGAAQFGIDFRASDKLIFNVDAKYITIDLEVKDAGGSSLGTVDVDPLVVGVGIGYRF